MKAIRIILLIILALSSVLVLLFWMMANGTGHRIPAESQLTFLFVFAILVAGFIALYRWR